MNSLIYNRLIATILLSIFAFSSNAMASIKEADCPLRIVSNSQSVIELSNDSGLGIKLEDRWAKIQQTQVLGENPWTFARYSENELARISVYTKEGGQQIHIAEIYATKKGDKKIMYLTYKKEHSLNNNKWVNAIFDGNSLSCREIQTSTIPIISSEQLKGFNVNTSNINFISSKEFYKQIGL